MENENQTEEAAVEAAVETTAPTPEATEESPPIQNETVKANLQKAYAERDEMAKKLKLMEEEKRQAELKALEEAGKKEEADKMRMEELQKQLQEERDRVISLTRDTAVRAALASYDFQSSRAAEMAYSDIVNNLVQDPSGNWVSRIGQSLDEYVQNYAGSEDNKFLFKAKPSSGSAAMNTAAAGQATTPSKPISEMSGLELVEHLEKGGEIPNDNSKWL